MTDPNLQPVLFPALFSKPVHIEFSTDHLSTNGGLVLLSVCDQQLGFTAALANQIKDTRQSGKVQHQYLEQLRQRVYGIAVGCPDGNDSAQLREDPMMKLACERDPVKGLALGSQSTISRFDNKPTATTLLRMSSVMADTVLGEQVQRRTGKKKPRRIIIDVDPTCDPTYGSQQLSFFNGFYDTACYLPLVVTVSFDGESRKYPVASILRAGNAGAMVGVLPMLRRLLKKVREHFGKVPVFFRADSAYAVPELFDYLESERIRYAIAMPSNAVLKRLSEVDMEKTREQVSTSGETVTRYGQGFYQSSGWTRERWAAYKAEVVVHPDKEEPRDNERFVINNLDGRYSGRGVFEFYYGHSHIENTIKELKNDLRMDLTSCSDFSANQFRVLLTLAAYILMQTLQAQSEHESLKKAQMGTLRERLLKIAVRVFSSARRIRLEFSRHHPWAKDWLDCATNLGARPG